jgi:hypothetical protein
VDEDREGRGEGGRGCWWELRAESAWPRDENARMENGDRERSSAAATACVRVGVEE